MQSKNTYLDEGGGGTRENSSKLFLYAMLCRIVVGLGTKFPSCSGGVYEPDLPKYKEEEAIDIVVLVISNSRHCIALDKRAWVMVIVGIGVSSQYQYSCALIPQTGPLVFH